MEKPLSTLTFGDSKTMGAAMVSGLFLVTSLLFAGCSSGPGSKPPALGEAAPPAAERPGTPTAIGTAASTEVGRSVPAATRGEASAAPAMEPTQVTPRPRPTQVPVPPVEPAPPKVAAPQPTARESTSAPHPEATKPVVAAAPEPAVAKAPTAVDIGGLVEVGATKSGLTRIGADKCKLCHKVQFTSWARTAHATRTPPLDCESCHGPGSEYKSLAIMKDAQKARAAGLVTPVRSFCSKCHTTGWSDNLLKQVHSHKAGA